MNLNDQVSQETHKTIITLNEMSSLTDHATQTPTPAALNQSSTSASALHSPRLQPARFQNSPHHLPVHRLCTVMSPVSPRHTLSAGVLDFGTQHRHPSRVCFHQPDPDTISARPRSGVARAACDRARASFRRRIPLERPSVSVIHFSSGEIIPLGSFHVKSLNIWYFLALPP